MTGSACTPRTRQRRQQHDLKWNQPGQRRGAGVIAMTEGRLPTAIALSTWFVAVRIEMTVPLRPGPEPAIM
jgi:hypothetical protein